MCTVVRSVCVLFCSDKYQLIGTLISDCSCHSNTNSAAAAAADGGNTPVTASEGINTPAAPASVSSSGLCVLV